MAKRLIGLSTAILILAGANTAHAGDTVLSTPMLSPPTGGHLVCNATNVGKKTLPFVRVAVVEMAAQSSHQCPDVRSALESHLDHTCTQSTTDAALCKVTFPGGSHKSVRAVLNVVDSSGATILSVPATK